jgi:ABC-type Fe3+-siderophore transport system permease subunit
MTFATSSGCRSVNIVLVAAALLTAALATAPLAKSTAAQTKSAFAHTKGTAPRTTIAPLKTISTASKAQRFSNVNRALFIHLEEGQKGLQNQLQTLTGTTQRRTDELVRRIDTLTDQLQRLAAKQQLLIATTRYMQLLLMIIAGLQLILCGALFFFGFQLKQFGGSMLKDRKQIDTVTREAPDGASEVPWKVGS